MRRGQHEYWFDWLRAFVLIAKMWILTWLGMLAVGIAGLHLGYDKCFVIGVIGLVAYNVASVKIEEAK